jgi:sulfur carrier protein
MRLVVNNTSLVTEACSLSQLVHALGHSQASVATAVNGQFVTNARRGEVNLRDQDRVEIVSAWPGG